MLPGQKQQPAINRFRNYVTEGEPSSCWEWQGPKGPHNYGALFVGKRESGRAHNVMAHRFAWELANGPIPEGLLVCHHCDNPPCCNPSHLFLGTQADNMRDAASKGRLPGPGTSGDSHYLRKMSHCKHGHPFDESNTCWLPNGTRQCRTCNREAGRRWRKKHPYRPRPKRPRLAANSTHCRHGHPYDEANTSWYGGKRYCKTCRRLFATKAIR